MRNWVLRIHLYPGLLCSSYLILFGVSSLNFNHPFPFTRPTTTTVTRERTLPLPPVADNAAESESVRDALGLIGWTLPWETRRDPAGDLHFGLARPGTHYTLHVLRRSGVVRVTEQRKGYWTVLRELHGNTAVPRSGRMTAWGWFTELCTLFVLFAALSGVYLFATRRKDRRAAWAVRAGATALSLGFMLYVRYGG
jgi:hypothetical protein